LSAPATRDIAKNSEHIGVANGGNCTTCTKVTANEKHACEGFYEAVDISCWQWLIMNFPSQKGF
jgi:hypothetical protein